MDSELDGSGVGAMLALIAIGLAIPVLVTYFETGLVPRLPTAILSMGLMVLAFLFVPAPGAPPGTVGSVNLPIFALTIAMTLLTAPIGANLAHGTDARRLRRIFAVFLLAVGLNMLRKALL